MQDWSRWKLSLTRMGKFDEISNITIRFKHLVLLQPCVKTGLVNLLKNTIRSPINSQMLSNFFANLRLMLCNKCC